MNVPANTRTGEARDGCKWEHKRLSDAYERARTIGSEQMVDGLECDIFKEGSLAPEILEYVPIAPQIYTKARTVFLRFISSSRKEGKQVAAKEI